MKKESTPQSEEAKTEIQRCFVIMPISNQDGYVEGHFTNVYNDLITPAIESAGYEAHRADDNKAASLIHLDIIRELIEAPMAVCDLSSKNPNVLFELGIRQAFNKPVILIKDESTPPIFDITGINTITYSRGLLYRDVIKSQEDIVEAIKHTSQLETEGKQVNSIIQLLKMTPASLEQLGTIGQDDKVDAILMNMNYLAHKIDRLEVQMPRESQNDNSLYGIEKRLVAIQNLLYNDMFSSNRLRVIRAELNALHEVIMESNSKSLIDLYEDVRRLSVSKWREQQLQEVKDVQQTSIS